MRRGHTSWWSEDMILLTKSIFWGLFDRNGWTGSHLIKNDSLAGILRDVLKAVWLMYRSGSLSH